MIFTLTPQERQALLQTAREVIDARLAARQPSFPLPTPALSTPCGAFVTLTAAGRLRGCIGHITASRPLVETVKDAALSSAFEDPRFPPLRAEEWSQVKIEISVLSPFQRITDAGAIEVGVHGILVRQGYHSGLLLPQVATEHGWQRDAFLSHTCRKAGLPADAWKSPDTQIEIFSALVFQEKE